MALVHLSEVNLELVSQRYAKQPFNWNKISSKAVVLSP
jgi:hypothetical protein